MKKLLFITAIGLTIPMFAQAVIKDVPILNLGDKEGYVEALTQEYPLPEGIVYEIDDDTLYLIGDGNESDKWTGYSKAESDRETERDLVKTLGVSAVLAMGYGAYKKYKK